MAKPSLSFEIIPTWDSRIIAVADISSWYHLTEESTYIDVTLPGSKTAVTQPFQKNKINILNSSNLAYGCVVNCEDDLSKLPDGIYKIRVYVCEGNKFSKEAHYLRTVNLELRLNQLLVNVGLGCNPDSGCVMDIMEAEMLIKGAKADLLFGNIKAANQKYTKAVEMVDDLENCECSKNCGDGSSTTVY